MNSYIAFFLAASSISFAGADKEAVRLKVREHQKEIRTCYTEALSQDPEIKGKVVVDWTINDAGVVTEVSVNETKTTLKNTRVQSCIIEKFKTWSFPPAPAGMTVTASYPISFSKLGKSPGF